MSRKLDNILDSLYHAGKHVKQRAIEEAAARKMKRRAFRELFKTIDELALYNKEKRKDDMAERS